jgi:hypothetical protein
VRLGDDEGRPRRVGTVPERVAGDTRVVAGARRLEVRDVDRVVDVAQRVRVAEADLDGVAVGEPALVRPRSRGQTRAPITCSDGR